MRSVLIAFILVITIPVHADSVADRITNTVLRRITVWRDQQVRHCRNAPQGCEARVRAFSKYFVEAGNQYDLDPWLLAAISLRESGMNPFARGHHASVPLREGGMMQINPCRSDLPKAVRYFVGECYRSKPVIRVRHMRRSQRYRVACREKVGACQREVVMFGARILRRGIEWCGNLREGLTAYNAGRCGDSPYAHRVLRLRDELKPSVPDA